MLRERSLVRTHEVDLLMRDRIFFTPSNHRKPAERKSSLFRILFIVF